MEDRNEELERIERELLAEEPQDLDELMKEFLEEPLQDAVDAQTAEAPEVSAPAFDSEETIVIPTEPVPAFDDPDQTVIPTDPVVYCNYSNDYGKDIQKTAEEEAALRKKKKDDNAIITLLSIAAGLSLGIIGVLVYWLVKFF
jgi:hypothetical protein